MDPAAGVPRPRADVDAVSRARLPDAAHARDPLRVGIVGYGAVGAPIADALAAGVDGLELVGVHALSPVPASMRVDSIVEIVDRADLVVEAASQDVVRAVGVDILRAGRDLFVVSVGALADDGLLRELTRAATGGGGRLLVTSGAIGGLDLLRAARRYGPMDEVRLTTTKPTNALAGPWMDERLVEELRVATAPVEVFRGTARQAVARFPLTMNVAATLALTTVGFERVEVQVFGDPAARGATHTISVRAAAGSYELTIGNRPSPTNPRTSAITGFAVLRELIDRTAPVVIGT